jgi:hypothetical protein
MYEILALEHNTIYDSRSSETSENALNMFIEFCSEFVSPEYIPEDLTAFNSGRLYMTYADRSGGDKPMLVMLIGHITEEMISAASSRLKKLYVGICEDCNANEIPITKSVCRECEIR